ncbi:DUF1810 domain-containing protein [Actinoplanes sp. NPDC049316]|uniref:DUF1810 domain-containing protein n=1 Tax=Actinoplanes sp. NPDC049316 TaxID=3154727 RepID=UPI00342C6835
MTQGEPGRTAGLERFVSAQECDYETALAELRRGRKETCWIWYVLPQLRGLGVSGTSDRYGISDLTEARAYMDHPVLGPRLVECTNALLESDAPSAEYVFGRLDAKKLHSSMTLFTLAAPHEQAFARVLRRYFKGRLDADTERLLDDIAESQRGPGRSGPHPAPGQPR